MIGWLALCGAAQAASPQLASALPTESFVGETVCFDNDLTNAGTPGFGPYLRLETQPDLALDSASFVGLSLTPTSVGVFPAAPGNTLTDPISGDSVTGTPGSTFSVIRYPVGSVVAGAPPLMMQLCLAVEANAAIDILQTSAIGTQAVYAFGDSATGTTPIVGTQTLGNFTPRVITYRIENMTTEGERPPGPEWTWDIEVIADIAADRTVNPIDFNTLSPIVLPPNVQFVGPVSFSNGSNCTASTPATPPPENPGGNVTLNCSSGTGSPGSDRDIVATFPVYIVDTLNEAVCTDASAINTAKHLTIQKGNGGGALPGATVAYTIDIDVSEFVDGIDRLQITDVLPDGLTFINAPTVSYDGGPANPIAATVNNDSPATGQTTVIYEVADAVGTLAAASSARISYSATIDQSYSGAPYAGEPIRARDTLTNTVTGSYDIVNGASSCSDDSSSTVTIQNIVPTKSIIGAPQVQPGDAVTWRLRLDIPSGDLQDIVFNDYFPLPVFDATSISTNPNLAANPNISFTSNSTLTANPTSISVDAGENRLTIAWPEVTSTSGETLEVDVSIVAGTEPFADGLILANLFQVVSNNSPTDAEADLTIVSVTLQEPALTIDKTVTSPTSNLEAGDTVSYLISITNDGSAEAYDVVVADTPDAGLTSCSMGAISGGSGTGDIFSGSLTFSAFSANSGTALDPGDTVTIAATCTLDDTVQNRTDYDNTASVSWATQPAATPFPAVTDSARVRTAQLRSFKAIDSTSETVTADGTTGVTSGDPRPVATGEIVRFRMWAYVPQGVTPNTRLRDVLPDGLAYVPGTETRVALISDGATGLSASGLSCAGGSPNFNGNQTTDLAALNPTCVIAPSSGGSGSGGDPFFNIGTVTNSQRDSNEELILLELNARVIGDVDRNTSMNNRFQVVTNNGSAISSNVYLTQTEPTLSVSKTATPDMVDASDQVVYTMVFEHDGASNSTAYDISFTDIIQPNLTFDATAGVTGPVAPAAPGGDSCSTANLSIDSSDPAGAGITITFDQLAVGDRCAVSYRATTASSVVPGQVISNTVNLAYDSLPGAGTTSNPTGSPPGAQATFTASSTETVTIDNVVLAKSIIATSESFTTDTAADSASDPRPLAIGETVTYRLQMRLPEGTAADFTVTDLLPSGLSYVANSARLALVSSSGTAISASPALSCSGGTLSQVGDETTVDSITPSCGIAPSGGPFGSGTDPQWALGELTNSNANSNQEFVVIEYQALVENISSNQNDALLENAYELSIGGIESASNPVFAAIAEPQVTLSAALSPNPVDNRIDSTPSAAWEINLSNTGDATAFQLGANGGGGFQLALPAGIANITGLTLVQTGNSFRNGTTTAISAADLLLTTSNATNDTLTFNSLLQMAPGASLTIQFNAEVQENVAPGTTLTSTESLVYAGNSVGDSAAGIRDSADQGSGTGNAPIDSTAALNDYRTDLALSLPTIAETPTLTVDKTISAGPVNNGDGTYSLTYRLALANTGDVNLRTVDVTDDLSTTFGGAAFTVNAIRVASDSSSLVGAGAFTGSGTTTALLDPASSTLPVGESGSVELDLTLTPGANLGPYSNTANGSAVSARSTASTTDAGTVDLTLVEAGAVGLAKRVIPAPVNNGDGSHTLSYGFRIENVGDVVLNNLQLTDNLSTTFGAAIFAIDAVSSPTLTVNNAYDGVATATLLAGSDSLPPGTAATVNLTVTVTPGATLGPYTNSAEAGATTPAGATLTDLSDNAAVVDENGNGNPGDDSDPTPVAFFEAPQLGVAKALAAAPVNNGDGSYTVSYTLTVVNSGDVNLTALNLSDDLSNTFAGAESFSVQSLSSAMLTVNSAYDGAATVDLLTGTDTLAAGATATVELAVQVIPGASLGPYNNLATGTGMSPANVVVTDQSVDGTDPDPDNNGDPGDNQAPTIVQFAENGGIGLAKSATLATPNFDGTFTSSVTLLVENTGDSLLRNVLVTDDLATQLAPATVLSVANLTATGALTAVNLNYDGVGVLTLTPGSESLAAGGQGSLTFDVTFDPAGNPSPFTNLATASAETPGNPNPGTPNVLDTSTDGPVVDANGNNDPTDDAVPTPIEYPAGTDGAVDITDESSPGEAVLVTVNDVDENFDSAVIESFDVTVLNDRTGESEQVRVTETGPDTGIFTATLQTTLGATAGTNNDAVINTQLDDTLTVSYEDRLAADGSVQLRTDTGRVLGLATLAGNAWLDTNTDDLFNPGERALAGWAVEVSRAGVVVANIPVAADGSYTAPDLQPGPDYAVTLLHPDTGTGFGRIDGIVLNPGLAVLEQNLPIDPSGVVYDSVERTPIADATVTFVNEQGTPLPDVCLLPNQQNQITAADGWYRFDLIPDADASCPSGGTYMLVVSVPADYSPGFSALLPPEAEPLDPSGLGSPLRVGDRESAPTLADSTRYYASFTLATGDPDVIWNHLPIDPIGVGGFSIRLTKSSDQRSTTIGGLVSYTITLENLSTVRLPGVNVVDSLPPGFSYIEDSAQLDGATDTLSVTGTRPVTFAGINLEPGQRRILRYALRAGVGLSNGEYTNTATPFIGPAQIGNSDQARIQLVADPDFEETTVIGKVWNDRDRDGWQDLAVATGIKVRLFSATNTAPDQEQSTTIAFGSEPPTTSERKLTNGLVLPTLPGRYGLADDSQANVATIRTRFRGAIKVERVELESREGTRLRLAGTDLQSQPRRDVKRGLSSQDLSIRVQTARVADDTEIIVTVTNNGFDEPGLPGVRLATVEGLLIETDAFGRYHIAAVDGGFLERGRNFIVKVDRQTLPADATFTTENPRVKRLSQGLMNRFDFGVELPNPPALEARLTVKFAEMFFKPGSAEVLEGYREGLQQLAERLKAGALVKLRIEAFADPQQNSTEAGASARALARQRGDALVEALCALAGEDVKAQLEFEFSVAEPASVIREDRAPREPKQAAPAPLVGLLGQLLDAALEFIVPAATAAEDAAASARLAEPGNCFAALCRDQQGIPVMIIEEDQASVYDNVDQLIDQGRVDLYGEYQTQLADGGAIWLTEDAAGLEPRLSLSGPSHLPVKAGAFTEDAEFLLYTNYGRFLQAVDIEVYRERDVDLREPLAVFPLNLAAGQRQLHRVTWPLAGQPVPAGATLVYRARARNADGLEDRTKAQRLFLIDDTLYQQQREHADAMSQSLAITARTFRVLSLDDGVAVFIPGRENQKDFEFRPQFSELGTELSAPDREVLDQVISEWQDAERISIRVVGHTSSVGIAKRSQHIFPDNYALSRARAQVVADYLSAGLGDRVDRTTAVGRGPDVPIASNAYGPGRALNRRADVSINGDRKDTEERVLIVEEDGSSNNLDEVRSLATLNQLNPAIDATIDSAVGSAADPTGVSSLSAEPDPIEQARLAPDSDAARRLASLLNRNDLESRRIPVYGSRVRLQGNDLGEDYQVRIDGERVVVDLDGQFAVEHLLPIGDHLLSLSVTDSNGLLVERDFPVTIDGRYQFLVALADFTLADQSVSGSLETLSGDDRYAEDMLVEGRLAFYLRGKIQGKYLITAQLDTQEEQLGDLFSNIHQKDPDSLFRRLDPDRYYPVYGDDSRVVADVNTQGRMYVRVDWDRSEATWGNFETGFTGTELSQYSRGLYGAQFTYESLDATAHEDSKTYGSAFVSEGQTALGHSEFLGTGGSLYYLRHTDILPGSDKLRIEIRDPDTNRIIDNQLLTREVDYEIDEIQGRVILSRPLLQVSQQSAPSLIVDGALDGNIAVLVADYEHVPNDFDSNNLVWGARGKRWFGDHVGIGLTYVDEGRTDEDYQLAGIDLTLKAAADTWLQIEYGASAATQTNRFFSTNGGLSFDNLSPTGIDDREGDAYSVDLHINAGDFGGNSEWVTNVWFKDVDDEYSVARRDDGNNIQEWGAETQAPISDRVRLGARVSHFDVQGQYQLTEYGAQLDARIGTRGNLATELKVQEESRVGGEDSEALLAGLQYEHQVTDRIALYGGGQTTLDSNGDYANNDQLSLGARLGLSASTTGQLEVRDGDRGNGALASLEHRLTETQTVYGTVTHSTDNTADPFARTDNGASMLDNVGTNWALGHRWRLGDRANLFTERQFSRNDEFNGVGNVFGLDYAAGGGWSLGFTAQDGALITGDETLDRTALSFSVVQQSRNRRFSSKLEVREDEGTDSLEQWLSSTRVDWKLSETYRVAARLNYSESDSAQGRAEDAKLIEGSLGLARRPHLDNRFNWLAKYVYLHDLQSLGQQTAVADQRSQIVSWEGIYRLNQRFDLGAKAARREGELRLNRNEGAWFSSTANFLAGRLRWHVLHKWDALAEYRWLQAEEASNERGGFLLTLNRHIASNFKLGVGYNFTDFSDDLTDFSYDHEGWFVNVVGKY